MNGENEVYLYQEELDKVNGEELNNGNIGDLRISTKGKTSTIIDSMGETEVANLINEEGSLIEGTLIAGDAWIIF